MIEAYRTYRAYEWFVIEQGVDNGQALVPGMLVRPKLFEDDIDIDVIPLGLVISKNEEATSILWGPDPMKRVPVDLSRSEVRRE